jgi:DNA-binding NarL/FixJ family response regulator
MSGAPVRIFIVDDHPLMRAGLAQLIANEPNFLIVGEASDASAALYGIQQTQPQLVIIDISLPGKNGIELIKDLHALHPQLLLLAHSMHDESLYAERVLRAGGRGYLMKNEGGRKLIEAIYAILRGERYISPGISERLKRESQPDASEIRDPVEQLSDRQFEIFQLIGHGKGTREIAQKLKVSHKTVDAHRANLKEKLALACGTELVRYAIAWVESQGKNA